MTWFDKGHSSPPEKMADKSSTRKPKSIVFAERSSAKKVIPAWIADQQRGASSLSGWLSTRPPPPGARPPSVMPPPLDGRSQKGGPTATATATATATSTSTATEAIEAQALSFEQGQRASLSVIPDGPPVPFESLAERLPESAAFLALEAAQSARMEAAIAGLERAIEEFAVLRTRTLDETEEQIVVLAAAIARRVIGREMTIDPGLMLALAAEGIDALGERDRIVVRIGGFEESHLPAMLERLRRRAPRCEIALDPSLGPGECVVESELGQVDESIDARLANVLHAVLPRPDR
jgi:flagellar biosynthesis/type III secretory pathway protein FliH